MLSRPLASIVWSWRPRNIVLQMPRCRSRRSGQLRSDQVWWSARLGGPGSLSLSGSRLHFGGVSSHRAPLECLSIPLGPTRARRNLACGRFFSVFAQFFACLVPADRRHGERGLSLPGVPPHSAPLKVGQPTRVKDRALRWSTRQTRSRAPVSTKCTSISRPSGPKRAQKRMGPVSGDRSAAAWQSSGELSSRGPRRAAPPNVRRGSGSCGRGRRTRCRRSP